MRREEERPPPLVRPFLHPKAPLPANRTLRSHTVSGERSLIGLGNLDEHFWPILSSILDYFQVKFRVFGKKLDAF